MGRLIKLISGNIKVEFDRGSFDDWCVFLTKSGNKRYAPRDTEYFTRLKDLGKIHGHAHIYNSFLRFYELTTKDIDERVLDLITTISYEFGDDAMEIDTWFTVIYAGMIAEENKTGAVLKKKIKRLGMHQLLLEDETPGYAADFSRNKKADVLNKLMQQRGF